VLAGAYSECGRYSDAIAMLEKAQALALANGKPELAQANSKLMEYFRAGKNIRAYLADIK
jgi:hypothetical protein